MFWVFLALTDMQKNIAHDIPTEIFISWNCCTSAFFHCVSLSLHYSIYQWRRGLFCTIQIVFLCLCQSRLFLYLCLFVIGPWAVGSEGPCHGSFYLMPLLWHYWWLNLYLPQWEKQRHLAHHLKSFYDVVALPELAKLKAALWKTSGTAEPSWKTCFSHNRKETNHKIVGGWFNVKRKMPI